MWLFMIACMIPAYALVIITTTPKPKNQPENVMIDDAVLDFVDARAYSGGSMMDSLGASADRDLFSPAPISVDLNGTDTLYILEPTLFAEGTSDTTDWVAIIGLPDLIVSVEHCSGADGEVRLDLAAALPVIAPYLTPGGTLIIDEQHPAYDDVADIIADLVTTICE
jgi:hypothetical protein